MRKERYRDTYLRWHRTYEKRATKELTRVFKGWAGELQLSGQPNQWQHQIDSSFDEEDLIKAYTRLYVEIGLKHGNRIGKAANMSKKDFNPEFFREAYEKYVAMYLQQHALARIFNIRSTFIEWLAGGLRKRAAEGMFGDSPDPSRVATWLQNQVRRRDFYRWQALRIARTESTAASNLGGVNAIKDSGYVMDKIWVSAHDPRTRRHPEDWFDHWEMDGKSVRMDEKFKLSSAKGGQDELEYPGDPSGHPANIINCRCTLIYKPRKVNGRLVRNNEI